MRIGTRSVGLKLSLLPSGEGKGEGNPINPCSDNLENLQGSFNRGVLMRLFIFFLIDVF